MLAHEQETANIPKYSRVNESDIVDYAYESLRLSKRLGDLFELRERILAACDSFLAELEATGQRGAHLVPACRVAIRLLASRPLDWFADWHDWDHAGERRGAAAILKIGERL